MGHMFYELMYASNPRFEFNNLRLYVYAQIQAHQVQNQKDEQLAIAQINDALNHECSYAETVDQNAM
ncbi:Hypothetical protein MVR_LOCUS25 [uncultured virus]|nr:Hypothetical protein MVR_LOCUS25 [uncultured virus]